MPYVLAALRTTGAQVSNVIHLIDCAAGCIHCDKPASKDCQCWIMLRCPCCERRMRVEREADDPPEAAVLVMPCPDCASQMPKHDPYYLSRVGRKLSA